MKTTDALRSVAQVLETCQGASLDYAFVFQALKVLTAEKSKEF